jgi:hypothetical protein
MGMKLTDIRYKNMYFVLKKREESIGDAVHLVWFRWRKQGEELGTISPISRRIN